MTENITEPTPEELALLDPAAAPQPNPYQSPDFGGSQESFND